MSERDTMIDTVRQELPALPAGEDGQDRLIGPDNPNYLPMIEAIADVRLRTQEKTRYEKLRDEKISELSELYSELENDTLDMPGIRKLLLYLCNNAGIRPSEKVEDIDISLEKQ